MESLEGLEGLEGLGGVEGLEGLEFWGFGGLKVWLNFQKAFAAEAVEYEKGNPEPDDAEQEAGDHIGWIMYFKVDPAGGDHCSH